eukprot:gene29987-39166_t
MGEGAIVPILYDLIYVKEFAVKSPSNSKEWIQKGILDLFPSSSESVRDEGERDCWPSKKLFVQDKEVDDVVEENTLLLQAA